MIPKVSRTVVDEARESILFRILDVFPVIIPGKFFQLKCNRASFKSQHNFSPYNPYILLQQNTDPVNCDLTITVMRDMERETWMKTTPAF
jgi:hypothetical protein